MSRRPPIAAIAGLVAVVAIGTWLLRNAARGSPPLVLYGTIEAEDVRVGSLTGGRVLEVRAAEGSVVAAGDTLVVLDPELLDLQISEQEARVAEARASFARAEAGPRTEQVERARIEADAAETERRRQEGLLAAGSIGQREYDNAVVAANVARQTWLEASRGSRVEDVAQARAALASAEGRLAYLRRQREESVVTAPGPAVIQLLELRPGDLVAAGQPIAQMLEPGQLWVRVYVPEPSLGLVSTGQSARITVDTFPDSAFAAHVVEIRQEAEYLPRNVQTLDQRSDQVFGVKLVLDSAEEAKRLKPGMAAAATLLGPDGQPVRAPRQ
jgi:multidrug resistance efflux pump